MLSAVLSESRTDGCVRRSVAFGGKEIWWEITGPSAVLPEELAVHDMAVSATIFSAMRRGCDLFVEGPVSESMLESSEDLVASWVNLRPDLYRRIKLGAAEVVPDNSLPRENKGKAVVAFSGGLDASYTAWRHAQGLAGRRNRQLLAGVLIHGFDIPLSGTDAFDFTRTSVAETLASINVPMAVVRTNWREVGCTAWEMEFGTGVATCLRNWQGMVDTALLGADEDYRRIVMPWGGNPLTYAMLSSHGFKVVYDGGEFGRSEKAAEVGAWETGLRNLRACWEGTVTGRNCGECEKCLRTKMNFLAVGAQLPQSLSGQPSPSKIRRIKVKNSAQLALLEEIRETARARQISGPWLDALNWAIWKNRIVLALRS